MPVYKRNPGLDADDYYDSGATVRRSARSSVQEPSTRRVPDNRAELFPSRQSPATQRRSAQNANTRPQRRPESLRDTRSFQDRRRADPPRAYYSAEPATQRLTRAEVNHRTVQQHAFRRAEQERLRREQEERQQREKEEEARRRRQHRIQTLFAFVSIVLVVAVAGGIFSLLVRYTQIEQMIVEQRKLTAEIDDQQKRLEELQVEINRQGNIAQIQDYARQNLNMDYAQKENTRVIALP